MSVRFDGRVSEAAGKVERYASTRGKWRPLKADAAVSSGDSLRTGAGSRLEITFRGDNTFRLDESSSARIDAGADRARQTWIEVYLGDGAVVSHIANLGDSARYRVRTPTAEASVEGTVFLVRYSPRARLSRVHCLEGKVRVINPLIAPAPPLMVVPGFATAVAFRAAPDRPVHIPPGQWKRLKRMLPHPLYVRYSQKFKPRGSKRHGPGGLAKFRGGSVLTPSGPRKAAPGLFAGKSPLKKPGAGPAFNVPGLQPGARPHKPGGGKPGGAKRKKTTQKKRGK
jgi:hypothetical protein